MIAFYQLVLEDFYYRKTVMYFESMILLTTYMNSLEGKDLQSFKIKGLTAKEFFDLADQE